MTYQEVLHRVTTVESAIIASGYSMSNSRLGQYKRDIEKLVDPAVLNDLRAHFTEKQMVQLLFSLGEAAEVWMIFETLHPIYAPILVRRLADVLSGPVGAAEENPKNTSSRARNTQFELHLMAQLVLAGFPILDETLTDVQSRFGDRDILIECKRPQRTESIRACVRDALHQLKREVRNNRAGALKMVAISLSKAITGGTDLWRVGDEDEGQRLLAESIGEIMQPHGRYFGQQAGPDIGGALVYATASVLRINRGSPGNVTQQVFFPNPAASPAAEAQTREWWEVFRGQIDEKQKDWS